MKERGSKGESKTRGDSKCGGACDIHIIHHHDVHKTNAQTQNPKITYDDMIHWRKNTQQTQPNPTQNKTKHMQYTLYLQIIPWHTRCNFLVCLVVWSELRTMPSVLKNHHHHLYVPVLNDTFPFFDGFSVVLWLLITTRVILWCLCVSVNEIRWKTDQMRRKRRSS